jgi:hypothetical protein
MAAPAIFSEEGTVNAHNRLQCIIINLLRGLAADPLWQRWLSLNSTYRSLATSLQDRPNECVCVVYWLLRTR